LKGGVAVLARHLSLGPGLQPEGDYDSDFARRSLKYLLKSEGFSPLAIEQVLDGRAFPG